MGARKRPYVVALTGGIASGKTVVSRAFEALGVPVIDTDVIAHELVAPGQPLLQSIRAEFGNEFIDQEGALRRRELRRRVFSDPEARRRLESLLHPAIREAAWSEIEALDAPYCILVVPLLVESSAFPDVDRVLVVDVPEAVQLERLIQRDGATLEEAKSALAAQASRAARLASADEVLENSGTLDALPDKVEKLHHLYLAAADSGGAETTIRKRANLTREKSVRAAAWLMAALVGLVLATLHLDTVLWKGLAHPVGNDAFYHLARMLEVARFPWSIHGFDAQTHWPDGMWVSAPWAYDWIAGALVSPWATHSEIITRVLLAYPVLWMLANITVMWLLARQLLPARMLVVCLLAYVLSPLSDYLFQYGNVDHHVAEHFWTLLATLLLGRWLAAPSCWRRAACLGMALAAATAFHNGLFLLQLPVLLALAWLRFRSGQQALDRKACLAFGGALFIGQVLVALPSAQLRSFEYAFYYLSWFHVHVSLLTAIATLSLSIRKPRLMAACWGLAGVLALPAAGQALHGLSFVRSELPMLSGIRETESPFWGAFSPMLITRFFTGLVWLTPLVFVYSAVRLTRRSLPGPEAAVYAFALLGLALMSLQVRFNYFGYAFLLLVLLMMVSRWLGRPRDVLYASLGLMAAYALSIPQLLSAPQPGGSPRYHHGYELIETLGSACTSEPGLLLADRNWGHFLRLRTNCVTIGNNFIMTEQDFAAIERGNRLLELAPDQLRTGAPEVRYVLASALEPNALSQSLLSEHPPAGFEMIAEKRNVRGELVGRVFRISANPSH